MKHCLLAILSAALFTSCAGVHVQDTYVATGAANPKSIYIRPFDVTHVNFKGHHPGGGAQRVIDRSQAGVQFAEALKVELSKLAPAMIINPNEMPRTGWIVEGELDVVHAGSPGLRAHLGPLGAGRSHVQIHVRVIDVSLLGSRTVAAKGKSSVTTVDTASSDGIIYAFTLRGGSGLTGAHGSLYAPGLGYATPFDFRNAAERVMLALSVEPFRYGVRSSPVQR